MNENWVGTNRLASLHNPTMMKAPPSTPAPKRRLSNANEAELSPSWSVTNGVQALKLKRKTDGANQPTRKAAYGRDRHTNGNSPPSTPPPSLLQRPSSTESTRSNSSTRKVTILSLDQRRHIYEGKMICLNQHAYEQASRLLKEGVSETEHYSNFTAYYRKEAARIYNECFKTYDDVVVFGVGDCGQLGCGDGMLSARVPHVVASLRNMSISAVAAGGLHTLVLADDGQVYSFGCNDEGALGGVVEDDGYQPCKVVGFVPSAFGPNGSNRGGVDLLNTSFETRKAQLGEANIVQIVAGETTSLALSEDGDVYMWGSYRDKEGRKFRHLPPPDDDRKPTGRKDMNAPRGNQDWPCHLYTLHQKATDISAGDGWAAALLKDESMVTWGIGTSGEMGRKVPKLDKTTSDSVVIEEFLTPKPPVWNMEVGAKRKVAGISCGAYHLLVLAREVGEGMMSVYSCGLNQYGQLGLGNELGDEKTRHELTKIKSLEGRDITKIEAGYHFSCFVNATGKELYSCGRSDCGQLGISLKQPDSGSFETIPVRVPLVYDIDVTKVSDPKGNCIIERDIVEEDQPVIEQISCGSTHVLVLTNDGDVYSWGFGEMGACGQGKSDDDVLRPKKLNPKDKNHIFKYVSGGGQHSAAVVVTQSNDSRAK